MAHEPPPAANERADSDEYWSKAWDRLRENKNMNEKLRGILAAAQAQVQGDTPKTEPTQSPGLVSWPDQIRKSCEDSKEKYEQKQWKVFINTKEHSLHSLWDKAIDTLGKLKALGTVATSAEPMASLGWSIVQLFIQVRPFSLLSCESQVLIGGI